MRSGRSTASMRSTVSPSRTRWTIRTRNFAHVVPIADGRPPAYARAAGSPGPLIVLTFRATGFLYDTLRTAGPPFFIPEWGTRWGPKVIGMSLTAPIDWDQLTLLITESYRLLAPKKLAAQLPPAP